MKIGVSSYSFSRLVRSGAMTQLEVIGKAKEMGFDVIEFSTLAVPEGKSLEDFAQEVRDECERVGIAPTNYTVGADFINGSGGDWQAEAERLKGEVRIARILGVPGMRHDATGGFRGAHRGARGFDDALPTLVRGCRAVTEYAAEFGIRTMVENHGYFCQDSVRVEALINGVDNPNFGVLIDIGNFSVVDEDNATAVGRLAPYAFHAHAKDFHLKPGSDPHPGRGWNVSRGGNYWRGAIIGHGNVPLVACLRALKRVGYDGVLSIEFEGMEDVLTGIATGLENLRRYVATVEG
ncbi:MAG: sugar phosphate isomerase/epimerase [Kiritimatiellaeota bacterium]|nr:sugar phosphate isomerase/epimerase [Kiritimatiellota bacterium]